MQRALILSLVLSAALLAAVGCRPEYGPASQQDDAASSPSDEPGGAPDGAPTIQDVPRLPSSLEEEAILPSYMTDEEQALAESMPVPFALHTTTPPTGSVRIPAEFEPTEGVVIHIPLSASTQDFFGRLVREVVASGATPYLLVSGASEASTVTTYFLTPYGTSRSDVEFIYVTNDAFWARDFGPYFIEHDGERAIVDMEYYPTRPSDDYVPVAMGDLWDEDVFSAPLFTEGGNFMTDGHGTCWASTGIFRSNRLSESQARTIYQQYLGCSTVRFITPLPGEGTTHIDMFSKILDEDTIMVAYSTASMGASTAQIRAFDQAAADYASTPHPGGGAWDIVRIPMVIDNRNGVFYAYTNSLFVNGSILVPTYGFTADTEALAAYRSALPGYRVAGVDSASVIPMGGSVHCTTMQVPVAPATTTPAATCGDGRVGSGEVCDGTSVSCADLGSGFTSGVATCNATCSGWNTSACTTSSSGGSAPTTITRSGSVARGAYVIIDGDWIETSGGAFTVSMTGTGDADLYVWQNESAPTWSNYACRPYASTSTERCDLSGAGFYLVAVRGYTASTYDMSITYTP